MLKLLVLLNLDVLQARYVLAACGLINLIMSLWPINSCVPVNCCLPQHLLYFCLSSLVNERQRSICLQVGIDKQDYKIIEFTKLLSLPLKLKGTDICHYINASFLIHVFQCFLAQFLTNLFNCQRILIKLSWKQKVFSFFNKQDWDRANRL